MMGRAGCTRSSDVAHDRLAAEAAGPDQDHDRNDPLPPLPTALGPDDEDPTTAMAESLAREEPRRLSWRMAGAVKRGLVVVIAGVAIYLVPSEPHRGCSGSAGPAFSRR